MVRQVKGMVKQRRFLKIGCIYFGLILVAVELKAQSSIQVTGTVSDEATLEPLPGVNIGVKGTASGTSTNIEGLYTLTADESDTLIFSFIGYQTEEIPVNGRATINVSLQQQSFVSDELVVVGYGTLQRADVSSSISTIRPEEFAQGSFTSPEEALQGMVPGLLMSKDGNPYGEASVVLRGPSTLRTGSAQEPFYVVDGVPGVSLDMVAVNDIVSIDVLRDAAATAIYGARAANGVIVITTSRGSANSTRVSYSGYLSRETISNKYDVLSGDEYSAWLAANGSAPKVTFDDGANTDWQDEVTRNALSHQNYLSVSGGTDNSTYIGALTYQTREGIMQGSELNRVRFRGNVENQLFDDKLRIGIDLTMARTESEHIPGAVLTQMLVYPPTQNIRNADGSFKEDYNEQNQNPVALIAQNIDERKNKTLLGSLSANYSPIDNLSFNIRTSYQNETNERGTFSSRDSYSARDIGGNALRSTREDETFITELHASYNTWLSEAHDFTILAGYSWQEDRIGNGFQVTTEGFPSDETGYYNLSLSSPREGYLPNLGSNNLLRMRQISVFSRLNYDYNDKYLLQVTIRRDGSSAFGADQRWGTFPSVSLGWWISEEQFLEGMPVGVKLRASYGESGNALGFNPLISRLRYGDAGSYYFDGEYRIGIAPTQNPNPNLRWETTKVTNLGLDWEAFDGRLSGTVDYYTKLTEDLIWNYPVSTTQYFTSSLTANVGEMENKGIEFLINAVPVSTQDFRWNASLNVSHNKNVVKTLSNDQFTLDQVNSGGVGGRGQSGSTQQLIRQGHPIGQFYLWEWAGYNEDGVSVFRTADGGTTTNPTTLDRFFHGDAQPDLIFGFQNRFTYKQIDLSFQLRGVTGNYILNASRAELMYAAEATRFNSIKEILDTPFTDNRSNFNSTRYLEKGDYLRLDNLTVGYTLPVDLLANVGLRSARIYGTVNNVFVITNYSGIDPEVNIGGITPGLDSGNYYPRTRSFLLGVNIDF